MKILENTIFRGKNKEIEELYKLQNKQFEDIEKLIKENNEKNIVINNLHQQLDELNKISAESIAKVMLENTKLKDKLAKTEKARRKNASSIGGLKKYINKLTDENEKLNITIELIQKDFDEFRKNKFIVKELKAEKVPRKGQVMNVKSGAKTSRIIAKVKPIEDETK